MWRSDHHTRDLATLESVWCESWPFNKIAGGKVLFVKKYVPPHVPRYRYVRESVPVTVTGDISKFHFLPIFLQGWVGFGWFLCSVSSQFCFFCMRNMGMLRSSWCRAVRQQQRACVFVCVFTYIVRERDRETERGFRERQREREIEHVSICNVRAVCLDIAFLP